VSPAVSEFAGVTLGAVDDDGAVVHHLRGEIDGFRMLTGVREAGGVLWFGSPQGAVVATTAVPEETSAVPQSAGAVP
jgi:hypothetical protein